jgi:hypothetical protein
MIANATPSSSPAARAADASNGGLGHVPPRWAARLRRHPRRHVGGARLSRQPLLQHARQLPGRPARGLVVHRLRVGRLLQLQGLVTIDWKPDAAPDGAQRTWRLRLENAVRRRDAFPFSWTFGDYAPTALATERGQPGRRAPTDSCRCQSPR